jgi:hypothetical protein
MAGFSWCGARRAMDAATESFYAQRFSITVVS